jgi:hypothetical protein
VTRFLKSWAGYGVASTALTLLFVALAPNLAGAAGFAGASAAIAVAALSDALEAAFLHRAVGRGSDAFLRAWGFGLAVKTALMGGAVVFVSASHVVDPQGFIQTLIAAFLVFTHAGIVRLARASNRMPRRVPSLSVAG